MSVHIPTCVLSTLVGTSRRDRISSLLDPLVPSAQASFVRSDRPPPFAHSLARNSSGVISYANFSGGGFSFFLHCIFFSLGGSGGGTQVDDDFFFARGGGGGGGGDGLTLKSLAAAGDDGSMLGYLCASGDREPTLGSLSLAGDL